MQWCAPYGVLTPASWMSFNAVRYMNTYGVTSEDFGRAVVQFRAYAATNPTAWGYGNPITFEDHQTSRWIAEPAIRLFDCCQETDGSVALVVTSSERAKDLPQPPVTVEASTTGGIFEQEIASDHYLPDLAVMEGARAMSGRVFSQAGLTPADVDAAMIYDAFTPIFFQQLEGLGFCAPGEAKDFVADGNLGPDGKLPCNTNGGLIGEGYIHGLNLVSEAVRQLRGDRGQPAVPGGPDDGVREPYGSAAREKLKIRPNDARCRLRYLASAAELCNCITDTVADSDHRRPGERRRLGQFGVLGADLEGFLVTARRLAEGVVAPARRRRPAKALQVARMAADPYQSGHGAP